MGHEQRSRETQHDLDARRAMEAEMRRRHPFLLPAIAIVANFMAFFTTPLYGMTRLERAGLWAVILYVLVHLM